MRLLQPRHKYVWLPVLITTMTVVAIAIGLLAFRAVETRQIAMTGDNLALTASAIADNLDAFLDDRLGYLEVASRAPVFKTHDAAAMTEYLEVVRAARHNSFVWLGATDATGRIIASTNPAILGQDRKTSPWFQAVRDTNAAHLGDVDTFTEANGVEAVSFTIPIMDLRGTFLGTVTAQVGIPALEEVLTRTVRSAQAKHDFSGMLEYQFLTRAGYAFVDSDLLHKGNVNLKHLGLRSALLAESEQPGYIEEEHLRRHVSVVTGYARTRGYANAPNLQWRILLRVDRSDVLAPTREALQHLAIPGAIVWLPMFALLLWATRRLRMEWQQAQDETAHVRAAEAALRESEQQTRAILAGALDAIIVLDSGGTITDWNPRAEAIFGWTRDEAVGRSLTETIIPLQYRNAHEQGLRRSLVGGGGSLANRRVEMTALRRDGTEFPVELAVNVLKNETTHRFTAFITDVTERRRAEEERKVLSTRNEALVKALGQIVYDWKPLSNELVWAGDYTKVLGYSTQEMGTTTESWTSRVHPDDLQRTFAEVGFAARERRNYDLEYRFRHRDGSYRWMHDRGVLATGSQGDVERVIGVFVDITERKRAEEALRMNEERYRSVVEDQTEVISRLRENGTFIFVNDVFCRFFGKSAHELIGTNWRPVVHPEDLPRIEAQLRTLSPSNPVVVIENRVHAGDGHARWMQFVNRGFFKPDGQLVEIQSVGRDITERKRAEEALAASEKRLRTILEAEPECVKVITEDGVLLDMNAAGLAMIEASGLDQVRGRSVLPIIAPDYRDAFGEITRRAYRGEPGTLQFVIIGLKGRRLWLETHAVPLRDEHGATTGVLAISRDITERKRAEDALRSSERVLRAVLKEREQLVQNLHDGIIQSLYAIGMSIEECRRLVEEDPEKASLKLEQEILDVNAVIRAVRGHLDQAEVDLPFSAAQFKAELTRVAGTMERANALHFRLKVDQRAAEHLMAEERKEILYIAQEAMSNCLRHSNASVANVSLRLGRDYVCLEVEDDGTGFDKKVLHGTHGGLRNIERRAAKLKAKIEIVSHREHGTRIRLNVPIQTSAGSHP